jgi:hypothetical protein
MMKLGTQTGSLTNHIYSRMPGDVGHIYRGMGATVLCWSDRHAGTITQIKTDKQNRTIIRVRQDHAKRVKGSVYNGDAEYEYAPNHLGSTYFFRRESNGWTEVTFNRDTKRWKKLDGRGVRIGERLEYYDPHF